MGMIRNQNKFKDWLEGLEVKASPGDFIEEPVSFEIFCKDWLDQPLHSPKIEVVDEILGKGNKEWSTKYQEALLMWGKGAGKDFLTTRLLTYIGYWLLCLKNPQRYFGIADGTPIDFGNVSVNGDQAKEVFFKEFVNTIKRIKNPKTGVNWFKEKGMDLRDDQDVQKRKVIFSSPQKKNLTAYSLDSERYTGEGRNLLVVIFDEVGAFKVDKAKTLRDNLMDTQTSRYPKFRKMILISYKFDDNDYMQIRWRETMKDSNVYHSGPKATWEMNPLRKKEDFQDKYNKDPEGAERVYECRGSTTKSGYFKYVDKIEQNYNKKRSSPLLEDELTIRNIKNLLFKKWFIGNFVEEIDILRRQTEKDETKINNILDQHSDSKYYIHIDLAKGKEGGDCAGFAMAHPYLLNPYDEDSEVGIYVDVMLQFKAESANGEIIFDDIRQLIYKLKKELNFNIVLVTLDGFQSVDFQQIIRNYGIESKTLSVDRDTKAYDTLKGLLYKNNLNYYNHLVFFRECKELKLEKGKVIHPVISNKRAELENDERGSKDVSDAVAGAAYSAIQTSDETASGDFADLK